MTDKEYEEAKATLVHADTEIAAMEQRGRDCIEKAREFNNLRAAIRNQITEAQTKVAPLRELVTAHEVEQKRLLSIQRRTEAVEAAKKAEGDRKAAVESEARDKTELVKTIEDLRRKLSESQKKE